MKMSGGSTRLGHWVKTFKSCDVGLNNNVFKSFVSGLYIKSKSKWELCVYNVCTM